MLSIRHLDAIIEADQCSCLQLMSSPRARWKSQLAWKLVCEYAFFSRWMSSRVLIFIGRGFFSCIFSFISRIILFGLWRDLSFCEFPGFRISHMFCILFHRGLVVMDLRCKTQGSTEVREGGGQVQYCLFAVILAIRFTHTNTHTHWFMCWNTHLAANKSKHTVTSKKARKHQADVLMQDIHVHVNTP